MSKNLMTKFKKENEAANKEPDIIKDNFPNDAGKTAEQHSEYKDLTEKNKDHLREVDKEENTENNTENLDKAFENFKKNNSNTDLSKLTEEVFILSQTFSEQVQSKVTKLLLNFKANEIIGTDQTEQKDKLNEIKFRLSHALSKKKDFNKSADSIISLIK